MTIDVKGLHLVWFSLTWLFACVQNYDGENR